MVSPLARREQLDFVRARGLSLRRACGLIGMSRATPSYEPRLTLPRFHVHQKVGNVLMTEKRDEQERVGSE